jgi:hypothetical protein
MTAGVWWMHWTIRAAMLLYVASILAQWRDRRTAARWSWTIGCLLLWLHVALAMHVVYHWDHAQLLRETARQTADLTGINWPGGVYLNYAFMLLWAADAAYWQIAGDQRYRRRAPWLSTIIQVFLAFIAINAVIVFAKGPVRWTGVAACAIVIAVAARRHWHRPTPAIHQYKNQ